MPVNFYEHSDSERVTVTEYPSGVKISPEQTLTFYSGLYLVSPADHVQLCSLTALAFKCQLCFIKGMMFNKCRWNNRPRSMTTKLSHVHITVCWPNFLVTFSLSQDDAKPRPKESFTIPGVGRRQTLTFRSKCQKFALNTRSVSVGEKLALDLTTSHRGTNLYIFLLKWVYMLCIYNFHKLLNAMHFHPCSWFFKALQSTVMVLKMIWKLFFLNAVVST